GGDHKGSAKLDGFARLAASVVHLAGHHTHHAAAALVPVLTLVTQSRVNMPTLANVGATCSSVLGKPLIKGGARQAQAIAGKGLQVMPRKFQPMPAAHHAQTLVGNPALVTRRGQT